MRDKVQLVQFSFLMFFVELTIIRWAGSNIFYIFFFANFILIASFLGMGLGFLRSKSKFNSFCLSPMLLMLVVLFCYYFSYEYQVKLNPLTDNLDYMQDFFKNNLYPVWITLPVIFLIVTALMMTIADGVARSFQKLPPLQAYRWEIIGSLMGIIVFSLLSFFHLSPIFWGMVIIVIYFSILISTWRANFFWLNALQILSLSLVMVIFGYESKISDHIWSSYYKISLKKYAGERYVVNVNGLAQQIIESVAQRKQVKPFYFFPYEFSTHKPLKKVLVIGAGTGGDVAIALAQGAEKVDAVEIDPVLYELGKKLNPDKPYADPRVQVFINDGRAYLQQTTEQYDLIIMALTDSLMLIPGQSMLRLENYLYTVESIQAISKHLNSEGIFTVYNYYRPDWFVDKLAKTLTVVFNQAPCLTRLAEKDYWATVLSISASPSALQCPVLWYETKNSTLLPATDNKPFVYLAENVIPVLYWLLFIFISFISWAFMKMMVGSFSGIKQYLDLFLMGAAFLLIETKNIINFALLFGSTWLVNALVFIGILITVYLAIEVVNYRSSLKAALLYFLLIATLFVSWLVPNHFLLSLSFPYRFTMAVLLAFSPIFIANLIFAQRFRLTEHSREAFGANLIGAVLGGMLEYSSIIIGYENLLVLIIVLYLMAILLMNRTKLKPSPV